MPITPQTSRVFPDEPCFELLEENRSVPVAGKGIRRIQIVRVIRADTLWEYQGDLGPAKNYTCGPFSLQGAVPLGDGRYDILETVERLQDVAADFRINNIPWPEFQRTDFVKAYEEIAQRRSDARVRRVRMAT